MSNLKKLAAAQKNQLAAQKDTLDALEAAMVKLREENVLAVAQVEHERQLLKTSQQQVLEVKLKCDETASGLRYAVIQPGESGQACMGNDTVSVNYTGYFEDGDIFDQTRAETGPATFSVGGANGRSMRSSPPRTVWTATPPATGTCTPTRTFW